ncbi:hypothetical protein H4219_004293 [Mycoemilia scoparia]|uniref:Uncharacterized protein n=1 Tax=Mycoemilia scoparia TaxID=417184 RepID=A0A9W7ZS63_9FUNG|nr:hypothetical protein H4219_004293 [Mycoemilia scoparia]
MLSVLSKVPFNASMAINLIIALLSFTIIIIAWCLTDRHKAVDQDTMVKSGFVVVYKQVYLLTAYINIALICGIATAGKFLCWTEIHNLLTRRYQTRESIYGFSKGMHAFIGNVVMTAVAICDPRVIKRGKVWAFIYTLCFLLAVLNALISTAVPQLLQKDVTLVSITRVQSQIESTVMQQKIKDMAPEDGIDNAAYMSRQVQDGKYLWEKIYQDAYTPENRTYTYISNWGHASVDGATDNSYPKSTPMTGKTRNVKGLDGFLTAISCHVIPCYDCSHTIESQNQDYQILNKFGTTNLTFYRDYTGIQYRVFWGIGPAYASGVGVADVNKTGMLREVSFYPMSNDADDYTYYLLFPGRVKVNCDFSIYTHNGKEDKGSERIFINNIRYFDHLPFADPMFTKYSATLDPQTVNGLLSEENILRNLTYNMHNAFRLLNDKLFRTQGKLSKVNDGEIEWAVRTDMHGYDLSIMAYATLLLAVTLVVYLFELLVMVFSKRLMPLISYTQEIDTRLSVVAVSGVPPLDGNPNMFGNSTDPKIDPVAGRHEDVKKKNQGNVLRKDSVFRWYKDSFVPEDPQGAYQMEMDALRQMQERNLAEAEQRRYYEEEMTKSRQSPGIHDWTPSNSGTPSTALTPGLTDTGNFVSNANIINNSVNRNPGFVIPQTAVGQDYQGEGTIGPQSAAQGVSLNTLPKPNVRFPKDVVSDGQAEDVGHSPCHFDNNNPQNSHWSEGQQEKPSFSDNHNIDGNQAQEKVHGCYIGRTFDQAPQLSIQFQDPLQLSIEMLDPYEKQQQQQQLNKEQCK